MPMYDLLAYIHPVWQGVALALALLTASWGLRLRSTRRGHVVEDRVALRRRHARTGLTTVALLALGWVHGLWSMPLVRREELFQTWHAWVGTAAVAMFLLGAYFGLRLYRPAQRAPGDPSWNPAEVRELHVFCMGVALLLGLVEIILGFPLLP